MDYTLLQELLAEEKVRDLKRIDAHRAEALALAPRSSFLRRVIASALVRVATALDSNVVRPAPSR